MVVGKSDHDRRRQQARRSSLKPVSQLLDAAPCSWVATVDEVVALSYRCDGGNVIGKFGGYGETGRGWFDTSHFDLHKHPAGSLRRYVDSVDHSPICTVAGAALGREVARARQCVPAPLRHCDQYIKRSLERGVTIQHWSVQWSGCFGVRYDFQHSPPFLGPYALPDMPASFCPSCEEDVRHSRWVNRHHSGIGSIQVLLKQAEAVMWCYDRDVMGVNCAAMDAFKLHNPGLARAAASCSFLSAMLTVNWSNTAHCEAGRSAEVSLSILILFGDPAIFLFPEYGVRLLLQHGDVMWFNNERAHCCEVIECSRGRSYLLTGYIKNKTLQQANLPNEVTMRIAQAAARMPRGRPCTASSVGMVRWPAACSGDETRHDVAKSPPPATDLVVAVSLSSGDSSSESGDEVQPPIVGDALAVLSNDEGAYVSAVVRSVRTFDDWGGLTEHYLEYADNQAQWENLNKLEWAMIGPSEVRDAELASALVVGESVDMGADMASTGVLPMEVGQAVRVWIPRENDGVSLSTGEHVLRCGVWFGAEVRRVELRGPEVWAQLDYVDGFQDTDMTRVCTRDGDCLNGQGYDPRSDGKLVTGGRKVALSLQKQLNALVSRDVVLLQQSSTWPRMHYDHSEHRWMPGEEVPHLDQMRGEGKPSAEGAMHLCVGGGGMVQTTEALGIPSWFIHDFTPPKSPGKDCLEFVRGQLEGSTVSTMPLLEVDADLTSRAQCRRVLNAAQRHWRQRKRRPEIATMGFPCNPFCKPSDRTGIHHPLATIALLFVQTLLDPGEGFLDITPEVFIFENSDEVVEHPVHQEFTRDLVALLETAYPVVRIAVGDELVYGYIGAEGESLPVDQMRSRFYMCCCINPHAGGRWQAPQPNACPAGLSAVVEAAAKLCLRHPVLGEHFKISQEKMKERWEVRQSDRAEAARNRTCPKRQHRIFPQGHSMTHGGTMRVYSCRSDRWVNAITTRGHDRGATNSVVIWCGHERHILPGDVMDWESIVNCPAKDWGMRCFTWAEKAVLFHFDAARIRMVVRVLTERKSGWLGLLRHVFGAGVGAGFCLAFTHCSVVASRGCDVDCTALPDSEHPTLRMSLIKDKFAVGGASLHCIYYLVDLDGCIWKSQWGVTCNMPLGTTDELAASPLLSRVGSGASGERTGLCGPPMLGQVV